MMRLLIVKSAEDLDLHMLEKDECIAYVTSILKYIWLPWANTWREVCADFYFTSVSSAELLMKICLRFIWVVNTATETFPMAYLSSVEFNQGREQREDVVLKTDRIAKMMDYAWMDHDRTYFISTAFSLSYDLPYSRVQWRQQDWDDEHFGQVNN